MAGSGTAHLRPHVADQVLVAEHLVVDHPAGRRRTVRAVADVSFDVRAGETLGLVGESGSGKSSTARALLQLPPPTSGRVLLEGTDLTALEGEALRRVRPRVQMIFQDPIGSLNPRRRVFDIVAEGLRIWTPGVEDLDGRVAEMLLAVGLDPAAARHHRPHQYSGGQCQRVAVARAMLLEPRVLVCDEPVSALDLSVQAQVLNLLDDMRTAHGLAMVFISHDLSVVEHVADRVAVMYLGKLCEVGAVDAVYARPAHPYTRALLEAATAPAAPPDSAPVVAEPASADALPGGCRYRDGCPRAADVCATTEPTMSPVPGHDDHWVACHFPDAPVATPAGRSDGG